MYATSVYGVLSVCSPPREKQPWREAPHLGSATVKNTNREARVALKMTTVFTEAAKQLRCLEKFSQSLLFT